MRDLDVRVAVRRMLADQYVGDPTTRVVEEMGVWSGSVRIDVAVINGELHGYELKSERDTLERLPAQAHLYNQVFDRVTLVIAERHARAATREIPEWWGIVLAVPDASRRATLQEARPSSCNPDVNALLIARLLWRSEALALLERYGIDRGVRSRTVEVMAARLAEHLALTDLKAQVREALKTRAGWLGQPVCNER